MIRIRALMKAILEPNRYIWMDIILIRETPRAILIIFDGKKAWIPKAEICNIKHKKDYCEPAKGGRSNRHQNIRILLGKAMS